jgi:hypothetical protein
MAQVHELQQKITDLQSQKGQAELEKDELQSSLATLSLQSEQKDRQDATQMQGLIRDLQNQLCVSHVCLQAAEAAAKERQARLEGHHAAKIRYNTKIDRLEKEAMHHATSSNMLVSLSSSIQQEIILRQTAVREKEQSEGHCRALATDLEDARAVDTVNKQLVADLKMRVHELENHASGLETGRTVELEKQITDQQHLIRQLQEDLSIQGGS